MIDSFVGLAFPKRCSLTNVWYCCECKQSAAVIALMSQQMHNAINLFINGSQIDGKL